MTTQNSFVFPKVAAILSLLALAACDSIPAATDTLSPQATAEKHEAAGQWPEALQDYDAALNANPDNPDILREKARTLLRAQRTQEARTTYEKAQTLAPTDTRILNGLGVTLDTVGDHDAAQALYRQVLAQNPHDLSALNNLARSFIVIGTAAPAIDLLEPVATAPEATPVLRQNLAEAYVLVGREAEAEKIEAQDAAPDQVQQDLTTYRARRAALLPATTPAPTPLYAETGTATDDATAQHLADKLTHHFPITMKGLHAVSVQTKNAQFYKVRVTGFENKAALHQFCHRLAKQKITCMAHEK